MFPATLFVPAISVAVAALFFGAWSFNVRRSKSTIGATLFAVGCGLAILVLGVYERYTWSRYSRDFIWWPAYISFTVFGFVFIFHAAKNAPKPSVFALGLMLGLIMLCVCGLVLWLMVACGKGDCI
jgi:uncharacterized membrane protein